MAKQRRSAIVVQRLLDEVAARLKDGDEAKIRIPDVARATGINYGSVYHHFGSREGVIDAAYDMMFSQLVDEDLALIRSVTEQAQSLDEYATELQPIVASLSSGPERRERRATRVRIVAAATTRPELRALIGATQTRVNEELRELLAHAQRRHWLRDDLDPGALAVFFQIMIFGRTLDDVSAAPVEESTWEGLLSVLFIELLYRG